MGFQVFINHRGADTKKTLASPIYYRLKKEGLSVFLDNKELETGDIIDVALEEAIESASVYIALFSPRYAESRYCLNELSQMMKRSCGERTFIPVFADIDPCHLRGIDRPPYRDFFAKHYTKFPSKVVEEWKKALGNAAAISGVVFKMGESDQGEFLELIAKLVLKALKRDVEVEEAAEDFQNKLKIQREFLNATKMGGLRKSTHARSDSSGSGCKTLDDEAVSSSSSGALRRPKSKDSEWRVVGTNNEASKHLGRRREYIQPRKMGEAGIDDEAVNSGSDEDGSGALRRPKRKDGKSTPARSDNLGTGYPQTPALRRPKRKDGKSTPARSDDLGTGYPPKRKDGKSTPARSDMTTVINNPRRPWNPTSCSIREEDVSSEDEDVSSEYDSTFRISIWL